jgi:hypothetical protein
MHLAEPDPLALRVVPPWLPKAVHGRWWSLVPKLLRVFQVAKLLRVIEVPKLLRAIEVPKLLRVVEVPKLLRVVEADTSPHSPLRQRRCYTTGQNILDRS